MDITGIINEQLSEFDLDQLESLMQQNTGETGLFHNITVGGLIQNLLNGEPMIDIQQLWSNFLNLLLGEVFTNITFIIEIIIVCIMIGLLQNISSSFGQDTTSNMAVIICSCTVIAICMHSVSGVYSICVGTVELMVTSMQALLPIMITLLASMGSFSSAGILNPVILLAVNLFSAAIKNVVLPALFLSCVFFLINSLTEKDYIRRLALFLRHFALFSVGLIITIFSGITAIQSIITKSADGMIGKTTKFSIDNFVPIIGGFVADSVDLILSCTHLIKNAVGIFGILLIVALMILPLIKVFIIAVIYKVASILVEPLGNKNVSNCINDMGNTIISFGAVLLLATIMFLIFLSILVSISSGVMVTGVS